MCSAYRVGDQMTCPTCRLTWDMNDPAPPDCNPPTVVIPPRALSPPRRSTESFHTAANWRPRRRSR